MTFAMASLIKRLNRLEITKVERQGALSHLVSEVPASVVAKATVTRSAPPLHALRSQAPTALICVIFTWNEFFFAYFLTATKAGTMSVFMVSFLQSEGLYWARLAAAASVASLPVILAGWIAQKQLVRGLSLGALK
jgi:sorbitol/mannitol transport system permease protein